MATLLDGVAEDEAACMPDKILSRRLPKMAGLPPLDLRAISVMILAEALSPIRAFRNFQRYALISCCMSMM
jgi:hypothetical protein